MLKTKINSKILIALAIMLLTLFTVNINTVNATSLTSEELRARIDILPDELTLNITETEYKKAPAEIEKQIKVVWEENNMPMDDVIVEYFGGKIDSVEEFYQGIVRLENSQGMEKTIKLVYSNTNSKDPSIEETIKNMEIKSPMYHEIPLNEFETLNDPTSIIGIAEKYYKSLIKDNTITLEVISTSGGGGAIDASMGVTIAFFKNENLYDVRNMGWEYLFPVINVPTTVADENVNEYLTNLLQNYVANSKLNKYGEKVLSVKAGNDSTETYVKIDNLPGAYTVKLAYESELDGSGTYSVAVIVKRTVPDTITVSNSETNIKLEAEEGVVPSNVVLEVAPVTEGTVYNTVKKVLSNMKQFKVFDINLLSDGAKIQPNGKVKITIPVPTEFNKESLVVYRVEENGNKTEYGVTVNGETATFETEHFSTYVLAEKSITDRGKDDTPKTGTMESIYFILPITIVSALGMIAFRKKIK